MSQVGVKVGVSVGVVVGVGVRVGVRAGVDYLDSHPDPEVGNWGRGRG